MLMKGNKQRKPSISKATYHDRDPIQKTLYRWNFYVDAMALMKPEITFTYRTHHMNVHVNGTENSAVWNSHLLTRCYAIMSDRKKKSETYHLQHLSCWLYPKVDVGKSSANAHAHVLQCTSNVWKLLYFNSKSCRASAVTFVGAHKLKVDHERSWTELNWLQLNWVELAYDCEVK